MVNASASPSPAPWPLVSRYTNRVVVLDEGRVVASGDTTEVLNSPTHPATAALSTTDSVAR